LNNVFRWSIIHQVEHVALVDGYGVLDEVCSTHVNCRKVAGVGGVTNCTSGQYYADHAENKQSGKYLFVHTNSFQRPLLFIVSPMLRVPISEHIWWYPITYNRRGAQRGEE